MPRCLLLAVRDGEARVWCATGFPEMPRGTASPVFPVHGAGIFHLLLGNDHYLGPLSEDTRHTAFYRQLGAPCPAEVFMAPVHLNDRLVALVVGDAGPRARIAGDVVDHMKLVRLLGLSLSLLVLKKKIRDVESAAPAAGPRPAVGIR